MVSYRIITDSTADVPKEWKIPFVPVHVYAGVAEFLDKIDFDVDVLQDLVKKGIKRRTSAPSVKDWMRKFEELGKDLPILAVTISSKLSASFKSAEIAARMLARKGFKIKVLDSWNGSIGIGLLVKHAKELAEKGVHIDVAFEELTKIRERIRLYLVVTDMDAAAQSGRIPGIVGKIGKFLHIHPIFHVIDGEIKVWKTVRGMEKVMDIFENLITGRTEVWVGVVGKNEYADNIAAFAKNSAESVEFLQVDPAIGAHFGYGAFGVAFIDE